MRIARVFPRRTALTPTDPLAFTCEQPPMLALPEIDEVHISVAFTWDVPKAERMAEAWLAAGVPVYVGGPAYNVPGTDFNPGLYLKEGALITSSGCPNRCWFCSVPKREGYNLRELPIESGWNVLDDNLLACSEDHIKAVFAMLGRQKHRPEFTGGLEARLLKPWHVDGIRALKPAPRRMYFAYDTPDDLEPLVEAGKMLRAGGFSAESHAAHCYVLVGYPGDTFDKAESRLTQTVKAGFFPYAMLYRDVDGRTELDWRKFQRTWLRPEIVYAKMMALEE